MKCLVAFSHLVPIHFPIFVKSFLFLAKTSSRSSLPPAMVKPAGMNTPEPTPGPMAQLRRKADEDVTSTRATKKPRTRVRYLQSNFPTSTWGIRPDIDFSSLPTVILAGSVTDANRKYVIHHLHLRRSTNGPFHSAIDKFLVLMSVALFFNLTS